MHEERIEVTAYAGYRDEEAPRAMVLHGSRIEVTRFLDQWTEEESGSHKRRRCFKVSGSDSRTHILCYDEDEQAWLYRE
jgi:hypothetical protein